MTPETHLTALDERLVGLPAVPSEHYLAAGRAGARRRRRRRVGVAAGVLVAGAFAVTWALPFGNGPQLAREHQPAVATPSAQTVASLSTLRVEPGVGGINAFTTSDVPAWATEHGNHGPAAIAPDGRLWIAPEATVLRSIADPFGEAGRAAGVAQSYAVEVRWDGHGPKNLGTNGVVWSFVYQESGVTATFGELDSPNRWTADFALWVDDKVLARLGRPSFAERLARFADDRSEQLVPGAGVQIVRQTPDVGTGGRQQHPRQTAAEVLIGGQTWFVLASGNAVGHAYYEAFDKTSAGVEDFEGFLRFLDAGLVSQDGAS